MLKIKHKSNREIVIPKGLQKLPSIPFLGAFVREPIKGLHDWVISIDVNSLYPFMVMKHNISFDTLITFSELRVKHPSLWKLIMKDVSKFEVDNFPTKYRNPFLEDDKQEKWEYMNMQEAIKRFKVDYFKKHNKEINFEKNYFNLLYRSPEDFMYVSILYSTIDKVFVNNLINYENQLKELNLIMTPNLCFYRRDYLGIQPQLNLELYEDRKIQKSGKKKYSSLYEHDKNNEEYANLLFEFSLGDYAAKIDLNGGYGANGNPSFQFFNINNATSVTSCGQLYMKRLGIDVDKYLCKTFNIQRSSIVGGDTDSQYIELGEFVKIIKNKGIVNDNEIIKYILKFYDKSLSIVINNSFSETNEMLNAIKYKDFGVKLEKISKYSFFYLRKRYIVGCLWDEGTYYDKVKIKSTGIRIKNINTPKFIADWLKDAIMLIFENKKSELKDYILLKEKEFNKLPLPVLANIVTIKNYNKYIVETKIIPPSMYEEKRSFYGATYYKNKCTPRSIKGAAYWNHLLRLNNIHGENVIENGDVVKLLKLKGYKTNEICICFKDDELLEKVLNRDLVDFKEMWQVMFMNVIEIFTKTLNWSTKDDIFDTLKKFGISF